MNCSLLKLELREIECKILIVYVLLNQWRYGTQCILHITVILYYKLQFRRTNVHVFIRILEEFVSSQSNPLNFETILEGPLNVLVI